MIKQNLRRLFSILFVVHLCFIFSGVILQASAVEVIERGVFYRLERPKGQPPHFYLFYVYTILVPNSLEELFLRQNDIRIIPTQDPKEGFLDIKGRNLPNKIYLSKDEEIRSGQIPGAFYMGTNTYALIEDEYEKNNLSTLIKLSKLPLKSKMHFSAAALVRLQMSDGSIVLVANKGVWNNGKQGISPGHVYPAALGGVLRAKASELATLSGVDRNFAKRAELRFQRGVLNGWTDINLFLRTEEWSNILKWTLKNIDRETNPLRELKEELITENSILTEDDWGQFNFADCEQLL